MIDHLTTYATDFAKTQRFYDVTLAILGYTRVVDMVATWNPDWPTQRMCAYGPGRPVYWVAEVREKSTPRHIAFVAANHAKVDEFHRAALPRCEPRLLVEPAPHGAWAWLLNGVNGPGRLLASARLTR